MTAVSVRYRPSSRPAPAAHGEQPLERQRAGCVRRLPDHVDAAHTGLGGGLGRLPEHACPGDDGPARLSLSWNSISGALSSTFIGTTTPPALSIPK